MRRIVVISLLLFAVEWSVAQCPQGCTKSFEYSPNKTGAVIKGDIFYKPGTYAYFWHFWIKNPRVVGYMYNGIEYNGNDLADVGIRFPITDISCYADMEGNMYLGINNVTHWDEFTERVFQKEYSQVEFHLSDDLKKDAREGYEDPYEHWKNSAVMNSIEVKKAYANGLPDIQSAIKRKLDQEKKASEKVETDSGSEDDDKDDEPAPSKPSYESQKSYSNTDRNITYDNTDAQIKRLQDQQRRLEQGGRQLEQQWSDKMAADRAAFSKQLEREEQREREEAKRKYEARKAQRAEEARKAEQFEDFAKKQTEEAKKDLWSSLKRSKEQYPKGKPLNQSNLGCSVCSYNRDTSFNYHLESLDIYQRHYQNLRYYTRAHANAKYHPVEVSFEYFYDTNDLYVALRETVSGQKWKPALDDNRYPAQRELYFHLLTGQLFGVRSKLEGYSELELFMSPSDMNEAVQLDNLNTSLPHHEGLVLTDGLMSPFDLERMMQMSYAWWHSVLKGQGGMQRAAELLLQYPSAQGLRVFKEIYKLELTGKVPTEVEQLLSEDYKKMAKKSDKQKRAIGRYVAMSSWIDDKNLISSGTQLSALEAAWMELKPFLKDFSEEEQSGFKSNYTENRKKLRKKLLTYPLPNGQEWRYPKSEFTHNGKAMELASVAQKSEDDWYTAGKPTLWKSMEISSVCPKGWRLPIGEELLSLIEYAKRDFKNSEIGRGSTEEEQFHHAFYNYFDFGTNKWGESYFLTTNDKQTKFRVFKMKNKQYTASDSWTQQIVPDLKLSKVDEGNYIYCHCVREKK